MDGSSTTQETNGLAGIGPLLFVAVLLFYFVTLTPFVDLTTAASIDPATEKSNLLNQVAFLGLTFGLWSFAFFSPMREQVAQPLSLLAAIAIWFIFVSAISNHPDIALKRVVLSLLTCINATILLLLPRSEAQFARLMTLCCLITLVIAYAGVVLIPDRAIHQASELREPMNAGFWRGHFPHKNSAAAAMVLISFVGVYLFSIGQRLVGAVILALAVVFLLHSGGKTSTAALPLTLLASWVFQRWPVTRIPLVVGGLLAINALTLGSANSEGVRGLVAAFGIDPTFTDRTDIWRLGTQAAAGRPLTGYGFQLFWQTEELYYATAGAASWAVQAFNGHNAYLDAVVTTGVPGFILTMLFVIAVPLLASLQLDVRSTRPELTRLYLNIWLYCLFTACVESTFFESGSLVWFMMVVAIAGLRLNAQAAVVSGAEPAAPGPRWIDRLAASLRAWHLGRDLERATPRPRSLRR